MSFRDEWNLSYPLNDSALDANVLSVRGRTTSGAGQFELAGQGTTADGTLVRARDIVGHDIFFELNVHGALRRIRIAERYPVREVGGKVRINVQEPNGAARPNIGNLFAILFLLPDVSQVGKSLPLHEDKLIAKTYWIDAVSVSIADYDVNTYILIPTRFVFATANKDDASQFTGAVAFNFQERLATLAAICQKGISITAGGVPAALKYYSDVLGGRTEFDPAIGTTMRKIITDYLEKCDAVSYQIGDDPLSALVELVNNRPWKDSLSHVEPEHRATISEPHNLIYFGAPGTGKSYELNKLALGADGKSGCFDETNVTRVTFHPDYTYAQFVGCFKPFIEPQIDEGSPASAIKYAPGRIEYRFVPGPFINTYVDAIRHPGQNYLLIIEEINRANPAAVFGDVFQLLDRKEDGTSEYSVATSEDLRWYLFKQWKSYLNGIKPQKRHGVLYSLDDPEAYELASSISLPNNMYIWATMNSADQGVFPMDTAFKRRWDFRYMGIDEGSDAIKDIAVPVGTPIRMVSWDALRRGINRVLLGAGVNEDKLLGPFFISPSRLRDANRFTQAFQDKVLLYLFEDAAKTKKSKVFSLAEKADRSVTYSRVCADFQERGELVFSGMKEIPRLDEVVSNEELVSDDTNSGE